MEELLDREKDYLPIPPKRSPREPMYAQIDNPEEEINQSEENYSKLRRSREKTKKRSSEIVAKKQKMEYENMKVPEEIVEVTRKENTTEDVSPEEL